jgi:hypothetical protein
VKEKIYLEVEEVEKVKEVIKYPGAGPVNSFV